MQSIQAHRHAHTRALPTTATQTDAFYCSPFKTATYNYTHGRVYALGCQMMIKLEVGRQAARLPA